MFFCRDSSNLDNRGNKQSEHYLYGYPTSAKLRSTVVCIYLKKHIKKEEKRYCRCRPLPQRKNL